MSRIWNEFWEEETLDSGALIIKRRSNNFGGHDRVGHRSLRFSTTPWSTVPFIKQEECFKLAHAQFLTAVVRLRYQIFSAVRNYKGSTVLYGFIRDATRLGREIRRDNEMRMIDSTTEYTNDSPKSRIFVSVEYLKHNFAHSTFCFRSRFSFTFYRFYHRWRAKN